MERVHRCFRSWLIVVSGHGLSPIGASCDSSDNLSDWSVWWLQMHQDIGYICLSEIHGLIQKRHNFIAYALELHLFCIKPSKRVITHSAKYTTTNSSWRHQMETFSAVLAYCAGNSPVASSCAISHTTDSQYCQHGDYRYPGIYFAISYL